MKRRIVSIITMLLAGSVFVTMLLTGFVFASQVHFYKLDEMIHMADTLVVAEVLVAKMPPASQPFDYEYTVKVKEVIKGKLKEKRVVVNIHYPYDPQKSIICPASGLESRLVIGKSYLLMFAAHELDAKKLILLRAEPPDSRDLILKLWKR